MATSIVLIGPHRTRPIRHLERFEWDRWTVKLYGISAAGEMPSVLVVAAARAATANHLPDRAEGHGVAFVVAHEAADFVFVLIDWWAGENELHQRLLSAPLDRPEALEPHPGPAVGCVWELAVVDFERRAWLQHVLANPDGPDLKGYLDARAHFDV